MTTALLILCSGILLGVGFFYGLWWTIQKGLKSKRPAMLFFASLIVRTGIALFAFYFISYGHWERLLICLLGFLIGRFIVSKFVSFSASSISSLVKEAEHASKPR